MDKQNDLLFQVADDLNELAIAARSVLADIPALWGDYQQDGKVMVSLSGDAISALESALDKAEGHRKAKGE